MCGYYNLHIQCKIPIQISESDHICRLNAQFYFAALHHFIRIMICDCHFIGFLHAMAIGKICPVIVLRDFTGKRKVQL